MEDTTMDGSLSPLAYSISSCAMGTPMGTAALRISIGAA